MPPRQLSRRRLFWWRLGAILISTCLGFVLAETAFRVYRYNQLLNQCRAQVLVLESAQRGGVLKMPWNGPEVFDDFMIKLHEAAVYDPDIGFRMLPNIEFNVCPPNLTPRKWRTNRHGHISDDDYPTGKPASEFRIITIGDSFTHGNNNAVRWQAVLQEKLNCNAAWKHYVGGKFTRVINLGLGGIGVGQFKAVYEVEGRKFEPDMVILNFITDDIPRRWYSMGRVKTPAEAEDHIHKNILGRLPWFRIYPELIASTKLGSKLGLRSKLDPQISRYYDSVEESVNVSVDAIRAIEKQQGPSVLLVHHPVCEELENHTVFVPDLLQKLEKRLGNTKVWYMAEYLCRLKKAEESYRQWYQLPFDVHPSDLGQEVYANALEMVLVERFATPSQ